MYLSKVLIFLSAALTDANNVANVWNWGFFSPPKEKADDLTSRCAPIQSNVHERIRCRHPKDAGNKLYDFDADCCSGSDTSIAPGRCAEGFTRTETKSCECDDEDVSKDCKEYTCTKYTPCADYVGCYKDQKDSPDLPFKVAAVLTNITTTQRKLYAPQYLMFGIVGSCANSCRMRNFSFAAVQGYNECWCGDSYGTYGEADERLCGKDANKVVATRCGDGDKETCLGVNAVYRLTGTEYCCDYKEPEAAKADDAGGFWAVWSIYLAIYITLGVLCGLFWTLAPCIIGLCLICSHERAQKRKREAAQVHAVAVSVIKPANQNAGLPSTVYDQL